jgi:hypothetical protein
MGEVALMDPSKTTDNKLRWQADVEGVNFKLYIPKWRVPRPWPIRILVRVIEMPSVTAQFQDFAPTVDSFDSLERPIRAIVEKIQEHTQTMRFAPTGDPKDWEIGEPYIPYSLLTNSSVQTVRIEVVWDRSAGTWSDE